MNNLIEAIWHQPEIQMWQYISQQTSPKVLVAAEAATPAAEEGAASATAAARGAAEPRAAAELAVGAGAEAAADRKCQTVLEYIWNWNLTWWQNN